MTHTQDCGFNSPETFECYRCGREFYYCCQCGGTDGGGDNDPDLCFACGLEYNRERDAEREAEEEQSAAERAAEDALVANAAESLRSALRARDIELSDVTTSALSASRYFTAGSWQVRVSDHCVNPYGVGFWKEDGTALHPDPDFELIVPADDAEISSLADEICERERAAMEDDD